MKVVMVMGKEKSVMRVVAGLELLIPSSGALEHLAVKSGQAEPHQELETATQEMVSRTMVRDRLCWGY